VKKQAATAQPNRDIEQGYAMQPGYTAVPQQVYVQQPAPMYNPPRTQCCTSFGCCGASFEVSFGLLAGFEVLAAVGYLVAVILWNDDMSLRICTVLQAVASGKMPIGIKGEFWAWGALSLINCILLFISAVVLVGLIFTKSKPELGKQVSVGAMVLNGILALTCLATWIWGGVVALAVLQVADNKAMDFGDWVTSKPGWATTINALSSLFAISFTISALQLANGWRHRLAGTM
jgi:hypothetical protein